MEDTAIDQQLLQRIGSGDTSAFWELWLRHAVYVGHICRRVGGDEDDVQDVMLKLMIKLPEHAAKISNPKAWMGKLAQNFCIDRYRGIRRRVDFVSLEDMELADPQSVCLNSVVRAPNLAAMLGRMPDGMREAIGLRFFQSLSYKQIAEKLNIPEPRIRKRVERAKRLLRQELENIRTQPLFRAEERTKASVRSENNCCCS